MGPRSWKMLSPKMIWLPKKFGSHKFLGPEKFWVEKKEGPDKILVLDY